LFQIPVRRSDEANVNPMGPGATKTFEFLLLQNAKQFWLRRERNVTNLVQKESPGMCQLKASCPLSDGASESTLFVSEELAFEKVER
jgi:hypothetical protein